MTCMAMSRSGWKAVMRPAIRYSHRMPLRSRQVLALPAWTAAARGATPRRACVPPAASGAGPANGSTFWGSALRGRFHRKRYLLALLHSYLLPCCFPLDPRKNMTLQSGVRDFLRRWRSLSGRRMTKDGQRAEASDPITANPAIGWERLFSEPNATTRFCDLAALEALLAPWCSWPEPS